MRLSWWLRHVLAAVLIGIAVPKILMSDSTIPHAALAAGVGVAEAAVAVLLLTRWWRLGAIACAALMLLFMVLANRGLFPSCGCLGAGIHMLATHRMILAAVLGAAAGTTLLVVPGGEPSDTPRRAGPTRAAHE